MENDDKIEVVFRLPAPTWGGALSEEDIQSAVKRIKDLPITMEESVVGLCRGATLNRETNEFEVHAVIWATVAGFDLFPRNKQSISFEIAKS